MCFYELIYEPLLGLEQRNVDLSLQAKDTPACRNYRQYITEILSQQDLGRGVVNRTVVDPMVPRLSRFAGSNLAGVNGFFSECKNPECDLLWKGNKAMGPVSYIYGT